MMFASILIPLLALAPQQGTPTTIPASPVSRIEISPRTRNITAGDSVQYTARALDAAGKPVPGATVRYNAKGGTGEGHIDSTGKVVASSVGKMPLTVVAIVPGYRPFIDSLDILFVPGPATRVELRGAPSRMVAGQQLRLLAIGFSKANDRSRDEIKWVSGAPAIARVDADGFVRAIKPGVATVTANAGSARQNVTIEVVASSIASLAVTPAKSSVRQGDVVRFSVIAKGADGKAIAGLSPTWSVAPGDAQIETDGGFVAYRPGDYVVTANFGKAGSASTLVHAAERDVRRPVSIVGRVGRTAFPTSEVWIHPNGKVAYLGTHGGGDRVYSLDISNPGNPTIVDSIQANTRLVNDMMTTPDGNYMVFTREGAADRKNGIVIADTRDPLHPKALSEFTEGVASGVHSAYVYKQEKYGTHVYLTNDGTGAVHVIDINDPAKPKEVAQYRTSRPDAARYVHDIDVENGLLYASYWNDGLVVLDIGNGIKGGRPDHPVVVTQFKYDLDSLYKEVEDVSGAGFTRGTHTAWRQRNGGKYVFIADEVYLNGPIKGGKDASASRMYGTLQVLDVSDILHPKTVAWYTPENGGVHNVWVVGDTLYIGAYDAGFHVYDISGELRGDLRSQGREIASVNTADMAGFAKNAAFTWGVVVNPKDGLAYVNDYNNGLWVIKIEPKLKKIVP